MRASRVVGFVLVLVLLDGGSAAAFAQVATDAEEPLVEEPSEAVGPPVAGSAQEAMAAAQADGERVEAVDERTASTTTFANPTAR